MNLNEYKILKLLNDSRKPLFFRKISRESKVSIGGTQQVLKDYSFFIDKKEEGRNTYYFLKDNPETKYLRMMIEIKKTQEFLSKNKLLKEFFQYFLKNNIHALVFGSYAKENINKKSDLDLLVLSDKKVPEHLCPKELHLVKMSRKEFEKACKNKETLIKEIIDSHIIINGFNYFTNWFNKNE
ncbi:nucleotidyltransferase domain-containing protein [Candidatus Woesearchaeota archaeon]|nr:nucleotidyltransferase domain-containing protein [Candidatus Woesearchaeota archaeon]